MSSKRPVTVLLGPTNTGKTYLAVERMLTYPTGMIGFPLRLLARENYERVAHLEGPESVALITGEERIIPRSPRFYMCTVEAMPRDRAVDFLAVDEIQLAADRERGHVFTERLLHARGRQETMLLGAETIRPLAMKLLAEAELITRPRLSTLSYAAPRKLSQLKKRTAVIAFSVAEVYEIAERVRRQSGGAAVVFGALSPRTRNAQVGLYEGGEVDYLVATDAIGMGLNLQIEHVVFTGLAKFDGLGPRTLRPAEIAQIAGRAGRHLKDGTFGATAELGPLPKPLVEAVEQHRFEPLSRIFWRNNELEFRSPRALIASLEQRPPSQQLVRMRGADDHRALSVLASDPEVVRVAQRPEMVELLWEVCQIPDFRNVMDERHTRLLGQVLRHLVGRARRLPEDWVASNVDRLDRTEGDLDTLLGRIADIRTWTYVSHRSAWLADAAYWQERTRTVEDRLSDALHERLTQQFVDRRAAVLARHNPEDLLAVVTERGEVLVQGLLAGRLEGLRFLPDPEVQQQSRGLLAAANRALRGDIGERVERLCEEADEAFALSVGGQVAWRGAPVARLLPGDEPLSPRIELLPSELLDVPLREKARRRLADWLGQHLATVLAPLARLRRAPLSGPARGLVFTLVESLGCVRRRSIAAQLTALSPSGRRLLTRLGLRLGRLSVFLPALLNPEATRLRGVLFAVHHRQAQAPLLDGRPSLNRPPDVTDAYLLACGYHPVAGRAVRVDRLERLASAADRRARHGAPAGKAELGALVGCSAGDVAALLEAIGYFFEPGGRLRRRRRRSRTRRASPQVL